MKLENVCIYRHKSFVPLDMSRGNAPMKFLNILLKIKSPCIRFSYNLQELTRNIRVEHHLAGFVHLFKAHVMSF